MQYDYVSVRDCFLCLIYTFLIKVVPGFLKDGPSNPHVTCYLLPKDHDFKIFYVYSRVLKMLLIVGIGGRRDHGPVGFQGFVTGFTTSPRLAINVGKVTGQSS